MRGQVSRKIMANSCEWGYEERQAGGKRRGRPKGDVNVGKKVVPSRGEKKVFLRLLKVIRLQVERPGKGNASRTINHASSMGHGSRDVRRSVHTFGPTIAWP